MKKILMLVALVPTMALAQPFPTGPSSQTNYPYGTLYNMTNGGTFNASTGLSNFLSSYVNGGMMAQPTNGYLITPIAGLYEYSANVGSTTAGNYTYQLYTNGVACPFVVGGGTNNPIGPMTVPVLGQAYLPVGGMSNQIVITKGTVLSTNLSNFAVQFKGP